MSRLGLKLEDYSRLVGQARSIPRLSGRCAVFAKTDIIHRQQEGVPTPDILLGLCYAMVRNYKAVIVRGLPVEKPVALCGGIGHNQGVIQAVREVFGLSEAELILPEKFPYAGAVGAAEAAMETATCSMGELLASLCGGALEGGNQMCRQPALRVLPGTLPSVPAATGTIPPDGCVLGIDVGSTSTDLVLTGRDGTLIDYQYLRTAGDPEGAVRRGLDAIHERFGPVSFLAVGVTGSGRERIGRLIGADAVRDEITAQARAAVHWSPDVDTVFEIGGQDSKYISLQGGQVADFQMNRICAAAFLASFGSCRPMYWLVTTAPPVARALMIWIIRVLKLSTRLTPETAASPTEETISVSARPMVTLSACSAISGSSRAMSCCRVNSGGLWNAGVLVAVIDSSVTVTRYTWIHDLYHTAERAELQEKIFCQENS